MPGHRSCARLRRDRRGLEYQTAARFSPSTIRQRTNPDVFTTG
jgi:hypothetical protein